MRRNPCVLRGFFRSADSFVRVFLPHRYLRADPALRDCPRSFGCGFATLRFLSLLAAKVSEIVSRTSRLRCTSPRQADEDEDESGATPTMAKGLFNHKIQIYFDFVM
jgi:hypothetical protein